MNYVFIDIDTQNDFIQADGALYVNGADKLKSIYDEISEFALKNKIPVLASADVHPGNDPEFDQFPPHCVRETKGTEKIDETKPELFFVQPNDNKPVSSKAMEKSHVLFEKQTFDVFSNPKIDTYLEYLKPDRVVVYGVATDYCVKAAVLGLRNRNYPVILLGDAIRAVDPTVEKNILESFKSRGVHITSFSEFSINFM